MGWFDGTFPPETRQGVLLVTKSDLFLSYETGLSYFNPSYDRFLNLTEKFWSLNLTKYLLHLNLTKQQVFDKVNNNPKVLICMNGYGSKLYLADVA